VDVYQLRAGDQAETQIHDLNPTQFPPVDLFWTLEVSKHSVEIDLEKGRASLQAFQVPNFDYTTIPNASFGGGPKPVPGWVSVRVVWSGMQERVDVRNTNSVGGFAGQFIRNKAQMEWTAAVGDYRFVSDPLQTSSSSLAEIGSEQNGSFFS
jgi:hypothetical protein